MIDNEAEYLQSICRSNSYLQKCVKPGFVLVAQKSPNSQQWLPSKYFSL